MMRRSKLAIGRTIGITSLVFYILAAYHLSLLQAHLPLPAQDAAAVLSADDSSKDKEESKRAIISEASDLEAVISGGVQRAIPKWHLQMPPLFALSAVCERPAAKPLHQNAFLAYFEALFKTLILPNAP